MRTVILLHKDKLERELLVLDWEARFDVQVFATANENQAFDKLEVYFIRNRLLPQENRHINHFPVFIFDQIKNKFSLSLKNQKFLNDNTNIFFINKLGDNADKSFELADIITIGDKYRDNFKIRVSYLGTIKVAPANFYLRIGESKYLKVINKKEEGLKDLRNHYLAKDIKFLYVKKEDHKKIMNMICKKLHRKFDAINSDPKVLRKNILNSIDVIHQSLLGLGIELIHIELFQKIVAAILIDMEKIDNVWDFLKDKYSYENYLSQHSLAIALICCSICTKFQSLNNMVSKRTFIFAALFHDAFLEEGRLVYMSNIQLNTELFLTSIEKRALTLHAKDASDLLRSIPNIPSNTDTIIMRHHDLATSQGFPGDNQSSKTDQIVEIFTLVEDFYHLYFQNGMNSDSKYFALITIKQYYKAEKFKHSLDHLDSLFIPPKKSAA